MKQEQSNVELMMKFIDLLQDVSQSQKELANLARENSAKIDRTWPHLARVEMRILELRRDVQETMGELREEAELSKKKWMRRGRKLRGLPTRLN